MFAPIVASLAVSTALFVQPAAESAADRAVRFQQIYQDTGNATLLWLMAEARAEAGQSDEAIALVRQVADRRLGFTITAESPLAKLAGNPAFDLLAARLKRDYRFDGGGRPIASLPFPGLIPEGIASTADGSRLFVGDMARRRIVEVRADGSQRLFATLDGLRPLGLKADEKRGVLWVAASTGFVADEIPRSAIVALDLADGSVRATHPADGPKSVNDLAIAPDGTLYVTDSLGGALYRLDPAQGRWTRITAPAGMGYPNGVAVNADGSAIYVAQGVALRRVDARTGEMTSVAQPRDLAFISLDGLAWHQGALIAVQNGGGSGRLLRFFLSADGTSIAGFDVLEAGHPRFDIPTTATVAGDRVILIANSQLDRLQKDGTISDGEPLAPIHILEVPIPDGDRTKQPEK